MKAMDLEAIPFLVKMLKEDFSNDEVTVPFQTHLFVINHFFVIYCELIFFVLLSPI
jgi:hypothetical protein